MKKKGKTSLIVKVSFKQRFHSVCSITLNINIYSFAFASVKDYNRIRYKGQTSHSVYTAHMQLGVRWGLNFTER